MKIEQLRKMFKRASLLENGAARAYILASTTGEIGRVPEPEEIIVDTFEDCGYQIFAMDDFFVAVWISDYSGNKDNHEFFIFEDGMFINSITADEYPNRFTEIFNVIVGGVQR